MIGYKRSIPERLSRSQVRMGRGSPHCEQLYEQIVLQFKNNISQRTISSGFHHLQSIISSKDSENLEKSLHV